MCRGKSGSLFSIIISCSSGATISYRKPEFKDSLSLDSPVQSVQDPPHEESDPVDSDALIIGAS